MPRYGFNFLWLFIKDDHRMQSAADCRQLDLMCEMGLDFVRLPMDYRFWTTGTAYTRMDEAFLEKLDAMLAACHERSLHVCLNLHRAPGFCINRPEIEAHRLWRDEEAQDGFVFQWQAFACRYASIPSERLSFDLVNEPTGTDEERVGHDRLIRRTVATIRAIDPAREIVIDGWHGGNRAMPELANLDVIQSGRGYQPFWLTHYRAPWCPQTLDYPLPSWPRQGGQNGPWDRDRLRQIYQPWRDLEAAGTRVHIGEFGCFNETPNDVALRWFADLLPLYREFGWGYSLWNFEGAFGIVNHGRPATTYESWHGYQVDRALLDLYLGNRIAKSIPCDRTEAER